MVLHLGESLELELERDRVYPLKSGENMKGRDIDCAYIDMLRENVPNWTDLIDG